MTPSQDPPVDLGMADPRRLHAVAHPVRLRLLYELHARGASRAADLAVALELPANQISFHLRQLARYGLVEEAPDRARDRRDRYWRAAFARFGPPHELVGGLEARQGLDYESQHAAARAHDAIDRFYAGQTRLAAGPSAQLWANNDVPMMLTRLEAERLQDELCEVLDRWLKYGREQSAAGNVDRRHTYLVLTFLGPLANPAGAPSEHAH